MEHFEGWSKASKFGTENTDKVYIIKMYATIFGYVVRQISHMDIWFH